MQFDVDSGPAARHALAHGPLLAAATFALFADDVFLQRQPLGGAVVHVLERDLELVDHVLALVGLASTPNSAACTPTTKEKNGWGDGLRVKQNISKARQRRCGPGHVLLRSHGTFKLH